MIVIAVADDQAAPKSGDPGGLRRVNIVEKRHHIADDTCQGSNHLSQVMPPAFWIGESKCMLPFRREAMSVTGIVEKRHGALVTLNLNNPPYNPIGVAQVAVLREVLGRLATERSVRAVLITGAGAQHFSVGANLKEAEQVALVGSRQFCAERHALYQQIEDMPKPVIAVIRGYCLGGGLELALACHFRLADTTAQLSLPEIDLGAAPMWGGAYRIVRAVGRARGLEMLLSGRRIGAEEALQWGLLQRVFPGEELEGAAIEYAAQLAAKAPLAIAAMLKVVNAQQDMPALEALAYELDEFDQLAGTRDNIEGVTALFEKRAPVFTGE
jgi:enoyl-CoA hydratase